GYEFQLEQFQHERLILGIVYVGQAQRILDKILAYAKMRRSFGKRLIEHQHLAFTLASLKTDAALLQQFIYHCVDLFMKQKECTCELAMLKWRSSALVRQVGDTAMQFFAGRGYMDDPEIARLFLDSRAASIAGGTDEVMQHIITKFL
nr:acyl-CoA dehydrogenase family protein [Ardenticatenales bacterium]